MSRWHLYCHQRGSCLHAYISLYCAIWKTLISLSILASVAYFELCWSGQRGAVSIGTPKNFSNFRSQTLLTVSTLNGTNHWELISVGLLAKAPKLGSQQETYFIIKYWILFLEQVTYLTLFLTFTSLLLLIFKFNSVQLAWFYINTGSCSLQSSSCKHHISDFNNWKNDFLKHAAFRWSW